MRVTQFANSGAPHTTSDLKTGKGLSRLLTAAVVSQEFCNLLLANPAIAVATGYNGEPFDLATEEQELILSIRATSLADFAEKLTKNGTANTNGNGNGCNGHNNYDKGYDRNGHNLGGL